MSYEIEYTRKAIKAKNQHGDDVFLCWSTVASNNVYPRRPSPMFMANGQRWEVISKICREIAPSCESGCWKPRNRRTTPEAYLRGWRKVLAEAETFEQFLAGRYVSLELEMPKAKLIAYRVTEPTATEKHSPKKYRWDRINEILSDFKLEECKWFDEEHVKVCKQVTSYGDVELMIELQNLLSEEKLLCWRIVLGGV